jgi:hypothetical protein
MGNGWRMNIKPPTGDISCFDQELDRAMRECRLIAATFKTNSAKTVKVRHRCLSDDLADDRLHLF